MFKSTMSSLLSLSILFTSFESVAGPKAILEDPRRNAPVVVSDGVDNVLEAYDEFTQNGPAFLNRKMVAELMYLFTMTQSEEMKETIKVYKSDLNALESDPRNVSCVRTPECQSLGLSADELKKLLRTNIDESEDLLERAKKETKEDLEDTFASPLNLIKCAQEAKNLFQVECLLKSRLLDEITPLFLNLHHKGTWAPNGVETFKTAVISLEYVSNERKMHSNTEQVTILYLKSVIPFIKLLSLLAINEGRQNLHQLVNECRTAIEGIVSINSLIDSLNDIYEMYQTLTLDGGYFTQENSDIFALYSESILSDYKIRMRAFREKSEKLFQSQNDIIHEALDSYIKKLRAENDIIQKMLQELKSKAKELEELVRTQKQEKQNVQSKTKKNEKQKVDSRENYVAAIKLDIATRQAEVERLERQKGQEAARAAKQVASIPKFTRLDDSSEGQLRRWYLESQESFPRNKDFRLKVVERYMSEQRKVDAKAKKSHTIDPLRAAEKGSSSSSSSTSSSSSSTSSTSSSASSTGTQYRLVLAPRYYETLKSLLTNKDSEIKIQKVRALFKLIGGYIEYSQSGSSTINMGLCHIDSGVAQISKLEEVIEEPEAESVDDDNDTNQDLPQLVKSSFHKTHPVGKNGRKGLRPEQILTIRKMLINAGYTLETVISKTDVTSESEE